MPEINWNELEEGCRTEKGCSPRFMKGRPSRKQLKDQNEIAKGFAAVRRAYEENPGASEAVVREQAYGFLSVGIITMLLQFIVPMLAKWAIEWALKRMNLPKQSTDRTYG